jgi:hypothetical protein
MDRSQTIAQEFVIGTREVVIELSQLEVGRLALEITLVLNGMAEGVILQSPSGQKVELSVGSTENVAKVERIAPSRLNFVLDQNQGEYLQAVLLRSYRDQMAEVNHIHIEGIEGPAVIDLTVLFQAYAPPMSPEAAAKLMGD